MSSGNQHGMEVERMLHIRDIPERATKACQTEMTDEVLEEQWTREWDSIKLVQVHSEEREEELQEKAKGRPIVKTIQSNESETFLDFATYKSVAHFPVRKDEIHWLDPAIIDMSPLSKVVRIRYDLTELKLMNFCAQL